MNKKFIEKIILNSFTEEPFHNLYFKYNITPTSSKFGGTCSDKVLSVYKILIKNDINVSLHSSFINNIESHRLLKIFIDGEYFFADIGNAWPSIKMFPLNKNYEYKAYGIIFRSIIHDDRMEIYQLKDNKEYLSLSIPFKCKSEELIKIDMKNRFSNSISYPFRNKIRFAQILDDKFYFLKDDTLYVYSNNDKYSKSINNLCDEELKTTLKKFFNFDLELFKEIGQINDK